MKLAIVKFRTPIAHPVTGQGPSAKDLFTAGPEVSLETVEGFVRITIQGVSRLTSVTQVLWAEELQEIVAKKVKTPKSAPEAA